MNKSSIIRLIVITLVMLSILLVLQKKDEVVNAGDLFVPEVGFNLDDIRKLLLRNGTEQLDIVRDSSGNWVLEQADNYLVDAGRLAALLRAIAASEMIEEKTSKPEYYSRLGVEGISSEGDTTEIKLNWDGGDTTILFGNAQGESYRYAREIDQPTSWLVNADVNLSLDPNTWLNTQLTDIDAKDVRHVNISHINGESLNISRDAAGYNLAELPEGRSLKYGSVLDNVVSSLSELTFDQVRSQEIDSKKSMKLADTTTTIGLSDDTDIIFNRFVEAEDQVSWFRLEVILPDPESTVLSASEIEAFRLATSGWEFQFANFKVEQITQTLENLLAPQK